MKYNGTIYRPPVEANTFLLPITEGCTHNSCTFCNMYARTDNIASKSDEDLKALRKAGVDDLYIGVECGLNDV